MKWYHWVKVVGIMATAIGGSLPLVLLAIALHLLCDFTLQSEWIAQHKANDRGVLLLHSMRYHRLLQ